MAWNPTPQVAHARSFARKFGADRVVILYTTPAGKAGYASYGKTRALCAATKRLADGLFDPFCEAVPEGLAPF